MKTDDKKIILDKYPSYSGKTKIIKANFLMNFVRLPTPTAKTKTARLVFKINLAAKAKEY
jgi:hypothetical protein